jgi:signal transduction histidine kinase
MKLHYKINIRFLIISVLLFIIAGVVFYIILGMVVHQNMDEILQARKENITKYLQSHSLSDATYQSPDKGFIIQLYQGKKYLQFSDTSIYDANDREMEPFRELCFTADANGQTYKIIIIQSLLESEDLIEVIFYFMLGLCALLVLMLFVLNYKLSFSIWKPFFATLHKLNSFQIGDTQHTHFPKTGTYEFDILNETLEKLTRKLQTDFVNLKEFTENASHEIQTPLAIIKSKLEITLHDPLLSENHRNAVHAAYESAIRLSKLNETLLLLSKIENRQFTDDSNIDLTVVIKERLNQIEELFELKNIKITAGIDKPFQVKMSPYLAEILINNILINAIKHNIANGEIIVTGDEHLLSISNTGTSLNIEPEKLFKRFVKQSTNVESTGLGLAIAYEICCIYHLTLQYNQVNGFHTFSLFQNSPS